MADIKIGKAIPFLVLFCLPGVALGKSYFTAAVFEHRPRALNTSQESPKEIITSNLNIYEKAIPLAVKKGADIILFSEYGLYLHVTDRKRLRQFMEDVPDPRNKRRNPCVDRNYNTFILSSLSCLAREYNIYIAANFGNIQTCTDTCDAEKIETCTSYCPKDGSLMYNAVVVFDREGYIVARYHKVHPYFEHVNNPEEDFVTFKTEFGTFGVAICFDAVFEDAMVLAKEHSIDTLLFSTFWYDDIVPFNSVEFQQSWALENGVNFMAANAHRPGTGSLGSGIYSKSEGALVYSYEPDGESKLLLANVKINDDAKVPDLRSIIVVNENGIYDKKEESGSLFPEYCLEDKAGPPKQIYNDYRCFKSHTARHTVVKLKGSSGHVEACHNKFCCSLTYSAEDLKDDFYLTAFSGINDVRQYFQWEEETCLLIRCDPFKDKPCVLHPSSSKTVFKRVELKALFESKTVYATVSKNKFRLAPKNEWDYTKHGNIVTLNFETDSSKTLLKMGLFGRNYEKDPPFIPYSTTLNL